MSVWKSLRKKREIIREYRCGDIKEKEMVQYLLDAVQPYSLRQQLTEMIRAGSAKERACRSDCKARKMFNKPACWKFTF